ncbi:Hypothetical protein BJL86_0333 [Dietzia timorensis]|uniref:Uncharacterized protein n=1 Tax=Dietzia timorensis TaxID=499555 RepID=A0A173LGZ4_9ACTN|nr:Hypothetical protein BJL86_0333 [Dietzia timorensis]
MTSHPIVTGLPSTHGDSYQLNTTTLLRHSARTYPEQEIVFRTIDGGWDRYTYADMFERVGKSAHALTGLGAGPERWWESWIGTPNAIWSCTGRFPVSHR